jgi:hypothetical protein
MIQVNVLALASLLLAPALLYAQATGQITGVVTDPSGAVVENAAIWVANQATGRVREVATGSDGVYTVPLVDPGTYQVKVSVPSFSTVVRNDIQVAVSGTSRVDFALRLGEVTEQITTIEAAPLVETRNSVLGVVVDSRQVVELPLNGRNFAQLGTLLPGVVASPSALGGLGGTATPGGFGNVTGSYNVNGMRNQSNNFQLDGSSNNDSFNSGFVLRPPPDAIQEFKILTHSYTAEYGRNAGSVVNVVTKSGTNQWHGSAWEFNRDDSLQARNFFATSMPALKQNQYGGSIGGPVVRNRLFLFGYYDGFNNRQGSTSTLTVLSSDERAGVFSSTVKDPLSGLPFANNRIPSDRISPIATKILSGYVPLPNSAANRLVRSPNVEDSRQQFGTRVDYQATAKHSLFGRYLFAHTNSYDPLGGSNFSPKGNRALARLQDGLGSDTWVISPTSINVVRVGWNRIGAQPTVTSGLNLKDLGFAYSGSNSTAAGLPYITVSGYFTAGDAQQPFANRVNNVVSFTDDFTRIAGRHVLKFGGELRRDQIDVTYINRPNGDFTFSGTYTGSAAADFLLGFPVQFRQATGDPNLIGSSWTYALYGQDEFRIRPRITLSYGLRYEVNAPFAEKDNHLAAFHPGQQSAVYPQAPTGLVYPGDTGVPRGTYATDRNNFAPRLAAVWDPWGNGRTSIRAAWGLFYDTVPGQGDFFQNGTLAPPFQPLTEVNFPLQATAPAFANPLIGATSGNGFPSGLTFIGWGTKFTTPVVTHYNLTLQQQIGEHWGLEAGYVASNGDHLPIFMEVNPTTPVLTPQVAIGARKFPAFGLVRPTFSVAKSWYNSLQTSLRLRPWHGLYGQAAYTWSHSDDHVSGLNIGGESRPILPVTIGNDATFDQALAREKGASLFDVRLSVVLAFGYQLPQFESAGRAVRFAAGGWQFNGIVQVQTGFPFTVTEPNNVSLTSLSNRPNLLSNPNDGAPHTVAQYFNTSAIQRLTLASNAGQIGNEGRDVVRGPGFNQADLSLFKNFPIAESRQIQFRIEAFNTFNHPHFYQPGAALGSPTFGAITSAADGRITQLAVKYTF